MDFFNHTTNWIKGEIFEARLIVLFAVIIIITALLFWKTGTTPGAKAMFFPLLVVGILFGSIGGGMLVSNPKRMAEFPKSFEKNSKAFIQSEKERVEEFKSWYPKTRYIMAVVAIIGVLSFLFWATPTGRSIGICLLLIGLGTFVVDHFSEERADIYYEAILEAGE